MIKVIIQLIDNDWLADQVIVKGDSTIDDATMIEIFNVLKQTLINNAEQPTH